MDIALLQLLRQVEIVAGFKILTPRDFDNLSVSIMDVTKQMLNAQTLKRIWGYLRNNHQPRVATLDILAQYAGYVDWETFKQKCSGEFSEVESHRILAPHINSEDLHVGDKLRVIWKPDRVCVFRYDGNQRFVVESSQNSKLSVGDTFSCKTFINGEALYLTDLITASNTPARSTIKYVCGKIGGIVVQVL